MENDITQLYLGSEDQQKIFWQCNHCKLNVKKHHEDFYKKIEDGQEKIAQDNLKEMSYRSGMMGVNLNLEEALSESENLPGPVPEGAYKACQ